MEGGRLENPACAACRMRRKKCRQDCLLVPYFPSSDAHKFSVVESVFGTKHVVKIIQGVPTEQGADTVASLVYEATARLKDPIYGCASTVRQLEEQIAELESQLEATQEELENMRQSRDKFLSLVMNGSHNDFEHVYCTSEQNEEVMSDSAEPLELWEPICSLKF